MRSTRFDLDNISAKLLAGLPPDEACILAWPLVCGSGVAERTEAVGFCNGILIVKVSDRSWKSQLESFTAQYSNKLSILLGTPVKVEYAIGDAADRFRTTRPAQ
jgi:hypothetical protein